MPGRVGLSPTMVGRAAQFEELVDLIDSGLVGCCDAPSIVMVSGEAGVGKTRLVREALAHFPTAAQLVVIGENADIDSFAMRGATTSGGIALAGESLDVESNEPDAIADELAATLSAPAGSIVVVDDVHWLDAKSAAVIDRLLRLGVPGMVMLLTFRPDELSRRRPGGDLMLRLERRQTVARIHVERLDLSDVGALLRIVLGRPVPATVIAAIHERTGGNPFAVEELARAYGDSCVDDLMSGALPWTLAEVVGGRLDGLQRDERRVIEAAAICGPSASFDVLAAVADLDEPTLLATLRALVDRDLLEERSHDDFAFRHALVRDAVTRQLLGRQRRHMHERVLEALGETGDLAARARHAHGAGRLVEFVDLGRRAAIEALGRGASFEALRLATEALQEEPDDTELLGVAAHASWLIGAHDEMGVAADRMLAVARQRGDLDVEATALRWAVRAAFETTRIDDMEAGLGRLTELVDLLPDGVARTETLLAIAQTHMLRHHPDQAQRWADLAAQAGERLGRKDLVAQAHIERASATLPHADQHTSAALLLEAIDEAEAAGNWTAVVRGINNVMAPVPVFSDEGRALLERFRAAARRAGYDWMATTMLTLREVEMAFGEADMPAVRRAIGRAAEYWNEPTNRALWLTGARIELALEEGNHQLAAALLESISDAPAPGQALCDLDMIWCDSLAVRLAALLGVSSIAEQLEALHLNELPDTYLARDLVLVAEAALVAGVAPARVRRKVVDDLADVSPLLRADVEPIVSGMVALADGRVAEGAEQLGQVLANPDRRLDRFVVGGLRTQLASALLELGDRAVALAEVELALEDLANWPGWRRDHAEALRRRLVGRTVPIAGELTAREREVAALLAEGLTNGQLAKRLFISPKTASVHVSNILMKLNMSTRAEVAAWAVRSGLALAS